MTRHTDSKAIAPAEIEELANIIMFLQRSLLLNLSKELSKGKVSFSQFFLLGHLAQQGLLSMSEVAEKMGHTTAAATGLVDRLEHFGYVSREHSQADRRKVMVKVTRRGTALVQRIREEMAASLSKMMKDLQPAEQKMWLEIYRKLFQYCQST